MPDHSEGRGLRIFEGHHSVHLKDGTLKINKNYKSRRKDGTDYVYNDNVTYPNVHKARQIASKDVKKTWGKVKLVWK